MNTGSFAEVVNKINKFDDKAKKIVDAAYLVGLLLLVTAEALFYALTYSVLLYDIFINTSTVILLLVALYRVVVQFPKDWKISLLALSVVAFGWLFLTFSYVYDFPVIALAIVGAIGFNGDQIILVSLVSNIIMIISNVYNTLVNDFGDMEYTNNDFFYLGKNSFYFQKMNNRSSTDFAAHYFWMIAAFLWLRGNKITWGEICALCGLNALVYSLTGSNTTLVCISLLLVIAIINKIQINVCKSKQSVENKSVPGLRNIVKNVFVFCSKYSFLIFAAITIALSFFYTTSSPVMSKLNVLLHQRLSLGSRAIMEHGVHLFAPGVRVYGGYSSADGFFNFIDCSYLSILIRFGLIPFAFYMLSMTVIQVRQKKYLLGVIILAVCALSCVEEHHLFELPYNVFILLLFADLNTDKMIVSAEVTNNRKKKKKIDKISVGSFVLCAAFIGGDIFVNYPRFVAIQDLDRLDNRAGVIYSGIQTNIDKQVADGTWKTITAEMSSSSYGNLLEHPDDFENVTGRYWNDVVNDPKEHSFYSIYYGSDIASNDNKMLDLMLTDEIKDLIGDGSVIVEYDVVSGTVYSVWYSEGAGCYVVNGGRHAYRAERLRMTSGRIGYSTGDDNG